MGDDISSGSVTDCCLRHFPTIDDTLSSAELHHGKNQNKRRNPNLYHHPLKIGCTEKATKFEKKLPLKI